MATNLLSPRQLASPITRQYINLTGVDFHNEPSRVSLNRSPDALNVYKNYQSSGECIETRPGWNLLGDFTDKINGLYFFEHGSGYIVIVHSGTKLYRWNGFPDEQELVTLYSDMADSKSQFIVFQNILYILDGENYLQYDGTLLTEVSVNAYIPTTTIGRSPTGGGEMYQPVNVLTPKRTNQFVGDGTSTAFALDSYDIDSTPVLAEVNGVAKIENTDFTVNRSTGVVTFNTAPSTPEISGQDNVFITFGKTISGYSDRIANCTLMTVFDNRVFYSGNPDYKNAVFHCKLENPAYISDLDYYQDGQDESKIKSMCVGNNVLWVFKESNQQNNTIYYHVPTLDTENGRIYPSAQGNVSIGCNSDSCNFNDDIVFMTEQGLEGVSGYISSEQVLSHRSTLVDSKMINEEDFDKCSFTEWQGYLLCLVNGSIYLADSRQLFRGIEGKEYEWYYWKDFAQEGVKLILLREYKGKLYLGFSNGNIGILEGTSDNGEIITSYWTTPEDVFGNENHYKTTNKRGGIIKLQSIPNSKVKVLEKTNKAETYKLIKEYSMTGFDFGDFDFGNVNFDIKSQNYLVVKIKEKKFVDISLKILSDELDRPFGLYGVTLESYVGGYIKK